MSRGKKMCPNCGEGCGPRSLNCKSCGAAFTFNPKKLSLNKVVKEKLDWHSLQRGDTIKVIAGTGPFFPYTNPESKQIEPIAVGHFGIFQVRSVEKDGIGAFEILPGGRQGGFCYIYMGKPKKGVTGTVMRPHKIKRVIRRIK